VTNTLKILTAGMMISLITGFAIFQCEKEIAVRQRGEDAVRGLALFAMSFEDDRMIFPHGIRFLFDSNQDREETAEMSVWSRDSVPSVISSDWDSGDDLFVSKLIAKAASRGGPVTDYSGGTGLQYVFSVYPIETPEDDTVFVVLREQVGEVRKYLGNLLKRMMLTAAATGIVTAGLFLVITGALKRN